MVKFFVCIFALSLALQARAETACVPAYQVRYSTCKKEFKERKPPALTTVRPDTGDCQPNDQAVCEGYLHDSMLKIDPAATLVQAYHKDIVGMCGNPLAGTWRARVDVYCTFTYSEPVYETTSDPSCPILGVTEMTGCYKWPLTYDISLDTIKGCVDSKPQNESDLWIKAACLIDVIHAQKSSLLQHNLPDDLLARANEQIQSAAQATTNSRAFTAYIKENLK